MAMLDDILSALMNGGQQQPGLMDLDSIMQSQGSTNPIPYPMSGMQAGMPSPVQPQPSTPAPSPSTFGQGGAPTPYFNSDYRAPSGMGTTETISKSLAMPGLMPGASTPATDVSSQRAAPPTPAAPAAPASSPGLLSGLFGGGSGSSPGFGDIMGAIGSGLMVASGDPNYVKYGLAQAGAMRKTADQRRLQSETAKYIKSRGIDPATAAFISRDPELMRTWFKSQQPDWKLQEIYDKEGRPAKVMMDMNSGHSFAVGGSKTDVLSKAAEEQKVRIAQAGATKQLGTVPPGYRVQYDQQGNPVSMAPIAGGPAAQKAADTEKAKIASEQADVAQAGRMLDTVNNIRKEISGASMPATGTLSRPFALMSNTAAGRVRARVQELQSGVALKKMMDLKAASSTGATGFGALSEKELSILINTIGALNPDTAEPDIFMHTLDRIDQQYKKVLEDIRKNVSPQRIKELGLDSLLSQGSPASGAPAAPAGGSIRRYNPATGKIE